MTKLFQTCFLLVMLSLAAGNSYGQQITYTTSGLCAPNQANYFGTPLCWNAPVSTCGTTPSLPPVTGTPPCPVTVVLNHEVNLSTFNFITNYTLRVNSGGKLNITNNITQTARAVSNLVIDGGQVNVGVSVVLSSGISTAKTTLRIETRNSGNFNVTNAFTTGNNSLVEISGDESGSLNTGTFNLGNLTNLNLNSGGIVNVSSNFNLNRPSNGTINLNGGEMNIDGTLNIATNGGSTLGTLNISGNGTGKSITTNLINLGNNARLDILANGFLTVNGITKYNGNDSQINVSGYFKTSEIDIAGGPGLQFNTFGSANVIVENNVKVAGNSTISFGGDSVIEIGGEFIVTPGANVDIGSNAQVLVCVPVDSNNQELMDLVEAGLILPCAILPVDYVYIQSVYSKVSNTNLLTWATAKEWENSGFEIERSIGTATEFEKIGEVSGMGWKESISEYKFVDALLPLSGGNIYYRLKQIDFDGSFELSKVVSIRVPGVQFTQGVWRAYPNPTDGSQFRISLLDPAQYNQEKITFRIIHPTSVSKEVLVNSENEMNEALAQMIGNIPKGVFVVELRWGQKIEHIKVLRKR